MNGISTHPSYSLPFSLLAGVQCQQIKVKKGDDAELEKAVEDGCRAVLDRTGGRGFPVLFTDDIPVLFESTVSRSSVVAAVQKVVGDILLYTNREIGNDNASEADVEEWLKRQKKGEEKRALVVDACLSRGWEADALLAMGTGRGTENLVMRTCGFCFLIKQDEGRKETTCPTGRLRWRM